MRLQIVSKSQRASVATLIVGVLSVNAPRIIAAIPDAVTRIEASAFVHAHPWLVPVVGTAAFVVTACCRSLIEDKSGVTPGPKAEG
jgi:hypothetical protein